MAAPNFTGVYALMLSEHLDDAAWKASINDRLMSAAKPSKDKLDKELASPRRQGAGYIDVAKALDTTVYLDGSADPTKLSGRSKIELYNNEDIKNGKIVLDFTTVSNELEAVNYSTELYVYRPNTVTGALDAERYDEKLANATLVTINDKLIEKVTGTLNVLPGNNAQKVTYNLSAAVKEELDGIFEYGCYIEGFLVLKAAGKVDISIPYLGFYGNYSDAIPVEPFKFERDESKVYGSDLLNSIGTKWKGLTGCDYASDWVSGNWDTMKDLSLEKYLYNETSLRELLDGNKNTVVPVGTNPYTGQIESDEIYMGNNGFSNTMLIAQFVSRTVTNNVITITNKATNEVVLVDHMYDALYGAYEDENGDYYQWPLFKSHLNIDWYSSGLFATRAYTIIPLYNYEYDKEKEEYTIGDNWADGEYEVKFDYEMFGGGTYQKKYTLHIDSDAPKINSIEDIEKDGEAYVRIRYEELKFSYLSINGYKYSISQDDKGYYYDIKVSDYTAKNKVYIKSYDFAQAINGSLTHINDQNRIVLSRTDFTNGHDFDQTFEELDNHQFSVSFTYKKSNKAVTLKGNVDVAINLKNYLYPNGVVKAYTLDKAGAKQEIEFTLNGNTIMFSGDAYATFVVDCDVTDLDDGTNPPAPSSSSNPGSSVAPAPSSEPVAQSSEAAAPSSEPASEAPSSSSSEVTPKPSSGCGGSILATSALSLIALSLAATFVLSNRKKKDD